MSRPIPPLYHWAPTARRRSIERLGLVPGKTPTICSPDWRAPYVCLAENPRWAWQLSGEMVDILGCLPVEHWDLWQVSLGDGHKITRLRNIEPRTDRRYYEWRVHDRIYKRGVWLVGVRVAPQR
jgi:hypothetical protein